MQSFVYDYRMDMNDLTEKLWQSPKFENVQTVDVLLKLDEDIVLSREAFSEGQHLKARRHLEKAFVNLLIAMHHLDINLEEALERQLESLPSPVEKTMHLFMIG